MHRIALNFEDGVTRFIDARPGELVADAAYRLGINIPLDCRDGACGTCKCHCESGDYALGEYLDDAMSEDEAREGFVLTCQMKARTDCVLSIPVASSLCKVKPAVLSAQMVEVRKLSPSTIGFCVRIPPGTALSYLPGQYMNVGVPGTSVSRAYSFSSMPQDGVVAFLVRNIPGGLMSGYLATAAKPGDTLTLNGPMGSFYLRDITRPVLMLAGGTGLAPFLAMLEQIQAKGTAHPVHMIFGVTKDEDLVELDKLTGFAAAIPGFTFTTVVADAASPHDRKGYVTHHMPDAVLHDGNVDLYLCGPPPMVDAVRQHLADKGLKPASFHFEKFNPSESK